MELHFVIYVNATPDRVWDALRAGQPIAAVMPGITLQSTFESGAPYAYVGATPDGSKVAFVQGTVLAVEPNRRMEMTYRTHGNPAESRVVYALEPEATRYTKLSVTQDRFADGDPNYAANADGWPRLLSNLKSFVETGEVMRFHGA